MTNTRTWGNKPRSGQWAQTTWQWCGGVQLSSPNTGRLQHADTPVTHTVLYICLESRQTRRAAVLWISGSVWNTHTFINTHTHTLTQSGTFTSVIGPSPVIVHKRSPTGCLHWTKLSWAEPNWSVCVWVKIVRMKTLTAEEKKRPNRNRAGNERLCQVGKRREEQA